MPPAPFDQNPTWQEVNKQLNANVQMSMVATADLALSDGVRDIILGRKPLSDYDGLVKTWASEAGEQMRKEYMDAMAAAK